MLSALPPLIGIAAIGVLLVLACRAFLCPTYPQAIVVSSLAAVVYANLSAEILSLFDAFSFTGILAAWSVLVLLLAALLIRRRESITGPELDLDTGEKAVYAGVGLLFLLTFLTGFLVAPNNWDSLNYHLPRAAHWLHQGGLWFFPSIDRSENLTNPLADIVIAHLLAAAPQARLEFMGQWIAGISVVIATGVLATHLHQSRYATAFTVLAAAAVPMFLAQMSTTQADLIAGVPIASAVVAWVWMASGRVTSGLLLFAIAVGASGAIKPTATILLVPVGILFVAWLLQRRDWRALLLGAGAMIAAIVVLNVGHAWRLHEQAGNAIGAASGVFNARPGLDVTGVNLIRDTLSLLATPFSSLNRWLESLGDSAARVFGWDLQNYVVSFYLGQAWTEDHASAPWHVALLAVAVVVMALRCRREPLSRAAWLVVVLACAFTLLAATFRWQPWINRFSFLVIVFASPLVGWLLCRSPRMIRFAIGGFLFTTAVAWVLFQPLRGLVGTSWMPASLPLADSIPRYASPLTEDRFTQMFMHHPGSAEVYAEALDYALSLKPTYVTIEMAEDIWEYPVWHVINERGVDAVVSHPSTPHLKAPSVEDGDTAVTICIGPCDESGLREVRFFENTGPPTPSVEQGHSLTVGRQLP